jgi:RNA-directed DNA polymerase
MVHWISLLESAKKSCEVLEQGWATGGGGDGGKRFDQGKSATAKRVPNSEPDRRAQCAGEIRQAASKDEEMRFTALSHHIYALEALRTAYLYLKREGAPGVDGGTWRHYGEDLEINLQDLSHRLKRGAYRAMPVRRVYIPKADGRLRPLGVTGLEDKIVPRLFVRVPSEAKPA